MASQDGVEAYSQDQTAQATPFTTRVPLCTSLSFSASASSFASSSTSSSSLPLKRTYSSTSELFTTAASSFHPVAPPRTRASHMPRSHPHLRNDPHVLLTTVMDPSPNDPNTLFLHPPFTKFPGIDKYPEGLTYNVMAENPEWFLDATDFVSYEETAPTNPRTIAYPTSLEPPRGWCPARKKDLKCRVDGWPEGEEPRLRCTFCRRTYAGVNAKSMWRRHVFEKHKIAMSNRREGPERPRGRGTGATKENRQPKHDRIVNIDVVPQGLSNDPSQKSRFRTALPLSSHDTPSTSQNNDLESCEQSERCSKQPFPTPTPPLTPHARLSDPASGSDDISLKTPGSLDHISCSPYDPSLTPSFRHCSPRLPSEKPWRWDSPSNPLSSARNLSLSLLAGELGTKSLDSPLLALGKGGNTKGLGTRTPLHTLGTPDSNIKTRRSFPRFPISSHLVDSPLGQSPLSRKPTCIHRKTLSEVSDDWAFGVTPPLPADPFVGGAAVPLNESLPSTYAESPVLRRDTYPARGLGIGLLEPFTLNGKPDSDRPSPENIEVNTCSSLDSSPTKSIRPRKKRRVTSPS
ncbi:hypothetical protein E1B28_001171 [Marasmius oreades]|uniref:Uncharacterized protein n=1 Tax=Marasmius oreades TaxID=181124 RepID=A0A9P8AF91_9AGAR|nr:uncharacterized protein E1B28_001171 [Marasmius oreades]KAG7099313.1 hypothetical protein E1B28_001171 [Marasmius oreades]